MKLGIRIKLAATIVLLSVLAASIPSYLSFKLAKSGYYNLINQRLQDQSKDWRLLVEAYDQEIIAQEKRVRRSAENVVTAQASMVYELIEKYLRDNNDSLPEAAQEDLFTILSRNKVGKTGYIWILDYKGNYIVSKDRIRDGENIWNAKDSDGNYMVQEIIEKGLAVKGSEVAIHSYFWLNNGEIKPREKISAIINVTKLGWLVGVSTYYDDLVDMEYRQRTIEHVKDLMAKQVIGNSGYIWVVDSRGSYQVSKGRSRDGEDISLAKDANGILFIQEAIKKAKSADGGTDIQVYPWQNKDEKTPRMKAAGLSYFKEWDWVIGVSAYYDDFQLGALGDMERYDYMFIALMLVIAALSSLVLIRAVRRSFSGSMILASNPDDDGPDPKDAVIDGNGMSKSAKKIVDSADSQRQRKNNKDE